MGLLLQRKWKEREGKSYFFSLCAWDCFVAEKNRKKEKKKKKIFFSSPCGFVWLLRNEFCERKWKGRTEKLILNFLIFILKVFNKLFIYLGYNGLNERVSN